MVGVVRCSILGHSYDRIEYLKAMWSVVRLFAPQSHSGESLVSYDYEFRERSKPVGVRPGDVMLRNLSLFNDSARACLYLAVRSKFELL